MIFLVVPYRPSLVSQRAARNAGGCQPALQFTYKVCSEEPLCLLGVNRTKTAPELVWNPRQDLSLCGLLHRFGGAAAPAAEKNLKGPLEGKRDSPIAVSVGHIPPLLGIVCHSELGSYRFIEVV